MSKQTTFISALAIAFALFTDYSVAAVPSVENVGKPANSSCTSKVFPMPSGSGQINLKQPILHFDKIIFAITDKLQAVNPDEQARLDTIPLNTELDIKVQDNPNAVTDIKAKVLSFLGAVANRQFYPSIKIIDVEYTAVLCPNYVN